MVTAFKGRFSGGSGCGWDFGDVTKDMTVSERIH